MSGRNGTNTLDPMKLSQLKANIRSVFPNMSDAEFEEVWLVCITAIANCCKNLRKQRLETDI